MNASPDVQRLLHYLLQGQYGRAELARWLAEHSLRILESSNELDKTVVADLDAALGEVQSSHQEERTLTQVAKQLIDGLGIDFLDKEIVLNGQGLVIVTGSANRGGLSTTAVVVETEVVHASG